MSGETDQFATSRAIDKLDPALHNFAEAVIDRITAISGNQQIANSEERQEVYKAIKDIRYQLAQANEKAAADAKNREQITTFLQSIIAQGDKQAELTKEVVGRLGKLETTSEALRTSVSELGGRVANLGENVDQVEGRVGKVEADVAELRNEVVLLTARVGAVESVLREVVAKQDATQAFLEAFPPIAEVQRLMDADRQG